MLDDSNQRLLILFSFFADSFIIGLFSARSDVDSARPLLRASGTRLLEGWEQKMDAGVDAGEEWLGGKWSRPAFRAIFIEITRVAVPRLRGEEFRLEIYDLLERVPVFTFVIDGKEPHQLVNVLDARGIAVRAGDMAAQPLLKRFGVKEAVRASSLFYSVAENSAELGHRGCGVVHGPHLAVLPRAS